MGGELLGAARRCSEVSVSRHVGALTSNGVFILADFIAGNQIIS